MDLKSALDVLGLEHGPGLTQEQVRRSYLRKLRAHPPERDPDGFKRLREAYERAQYLLQFEDDPPPASVEQDAGEPDGHNEQDRRVDVREREDDGHIDEDDPDHDPEIDAHAEWSAHTTSSPLDELIDDVLDLVDAGKLEAAAARAQAVPPDHGDYRIGQNQALRWMLTRELVAIAAVPPGEVRRALVEGVRTLELAEARERIYRYYYGHNSKARPVIKAMKKRAPSLFALVETGFAPPIDWQEARGLGVALAIFILYFALKYCGGLR